MTARAAFSAAWGRGGPTRSSLRIATSTSGCSHCQSLSIETECNYPLAHVPRRALAAGRSTRCAAGSVVPVRRKHNAPLACWPVASLLRGRPCIAHLLAGGGRPTRADPFRSLCVVILCRGVSRFRPGSLRELQSAKCRKPQWKERLHMHAAGVKQWASVLRR